jgi:dethiobiotin synthetase
MSPHAAAGIDGVNILSDQIKEPQTANHLVIEGAGGLLVPINENETILDLIKPTYKVVIVSRHYLGSINHSLLTIGWLKERGFEVSILFSGDEHPTTEEIILSKTGIQCIGRINEEQSFDAVVIRRYATQFREKLMAL